MPRFCIALLRKVIRQNEINRILTTYSDYKGVEFLPRVLEELNLKVEIEGIDNLPDNGKCFFVANHPFGFVDGMVLTNTVAGKYGNFKAIGNEIFMLVPHVRSIIAAVNVWGTNSRSYINELEKVFSSGMPITHFPAGKVSRLSKGRVEDGEWQKSFIKKAVEHKRDIVPFYFPGRNSLLFYTVFILRRALGVRATLELALLPHEIFNKRNKTIRVRIGRPISFQTFDNSRSYYDWAQYVKGQVYSLRTLT